MPDLTLRSSEQAALRALLSAEPVPGRPVPPLHLLEAIERLVPCDGMGVTLADNEGYSVEAVMLHPSFNDDWPDQETGGGGPLFIGVMHWSHSPREAEACAALAGCQDGVAIGFRNGPDHVTQLWLDRKDASFTRRDMALLDLLSPVLRRLFRERPTPLLPATLTVQERRVLMHVASGQSNAEIAEDLFVASSTVRKHLEHTYRKLGVTSRLAAVARLQGRNLADVELQARIERFS